MSTTPYLTLVIWVPILAGALVLATGLPTELFAEEKKAEEPKWGGDAMANGLRDDPTLSEDDIASYCRENFTAYKRPKYIEFRDELPKSNVGKILRRELRTAKA